MPTWRLAPTLVQLRAEINAEWSLRDKTSDGTLGNAAHAASRSDHNPDSRGVVCAIDIDEDLTGSTKPYPSFNPGQPAKAALVDRLLDLARDGKLPQLYYVIYEGKIYSRTNGFAARDYNGANAHDHHVHVSVYHDARHADRTTPWGIRPPQPVIKPVVAKVKIGLAAAQAGMRAAGKGEPSDEAKLIQVALNTWRPSFKLAEDGYFGRASRTAAAVFQVYISDPPKPTPWPNTGWDAGDGTTDGWGDADGILGRQSLTALGFDVQP